jgi:hypothetical protein
LTTAAPSFTTATPAVAFSLTVSIRLVMSMLSGILNGSHDDIGFRVRVVSKYSVFVQSRMAGAMTR